jgi:DNA-binding FadR family transcriptional regulator
VILTSSEAAVDADWGPVPRTRAHELVLRRIEEQILGGRLRVGDRLPGERQLATMLGVSRPALREALRVLEAEGVLVAHVGRGPDAGATIAAQPEDALNRLMRLHLALSHYRLEEVLEARVMLERWGVAEAARRGDPERIAEAERILDLMDDPTLSPEKFSDLDSRFHSELALSSGNHLLGNVSAALREAVRPLILEVLQEAPDWPATATALRRQHREILRAIQEARVEDVTSAIEEHIRDFHSLLVERVGTGFPAAQRDVAREYRVSGG